MQIKLVLDTPFAMINSGPSSIVERIDSNLPFAPHLEELAKKAVSNIELQSGSRSFNGLHLRVEADAHQMHEDMGGPEAIQGMYEEGLQIAGINNTEPLFVASGVFLKVPEGSDKDEQILSNPWYKFCDEVRSLLHACYSIGLLSQHFLIF